MAHMAWEGKQLLLRAPARGGSGWSLEWLTIGCPGSVLAGGQNLGQEAPEVPQWGEGDAEPTQMPRHEVREAAGKPGMWPF